MSNNNNKANQKNSNPDTPGYNKEHQKVLDNRAKQLNPQSSEHKDSKQK